MRFLLGKALLVLLPDRDGRHEGIRGLKSKLAMQIGGQVSRGCHRRSCDEVVEVHGFGVGRALICRFAQLCDAARCAWLRL